MSRRQPRVLAVGDAIVDLVTPPMPRFPAGDFQTEVSGFAALPGGNATNFALQVATLGAKTTFIGAVGTDPNAEILRRAYRKYGVRAILRADRDRPSGATIALTRSTGGRTLVTALGANASLRFRDIPTGAFRGADHVHRAGFWWTPSLIGEPTVTLLARAHRTGATTSLDVSTDPRGWPRERVDAVRMCLPHVDTFFGNETEVCAIAGIRHPVRAAKWLCSIGVAEVVIHQGARGSTSVTRTDVVRRRAIDVPVDNPTGCGDVFNAAYVYMRLAGESTSEALRVANGCAALHLRDRRRPYPSLAAVRRFLRRFALP